MEKLKHNFLRLLKSLTNIVTVVALILTVLGAVMAIFYDELIVAFETIGMTQETMAWATVALGGLGTAGIMTTKVASTLRASLLLTKNDVEKTQEAFEKKQTIALHNINVQHAQKVREMKEEHDLRIAQLEARDQEREDRLAGYEEQMALQLKFDRAQALKYVNAPDNLVNAETKAAYQEYLDATETRKV